MRIYTRRRIVYRIVGACLFAQKLWLGLRTLVVGGAESLDSLSSFAALLLLVGNIVYKVKVEKKKRGGDCRTDSKTVSERLCSRVGTI